MKIRLSTRLWLAWQIVRGRVVEASFSTHPERTTVVLAGRSIYKRLWGE